MAIWIIWGKLLQEEGTTEAKAEGGHLRTSKEAMGLE